MQLHFIVLNQLCQQHSVEGRKTGGLCAADELVWFCVSGAEVWTEICGMLVASARTDTPGNSLFVLRLLL